MTQATGQPLEDTVPISVLHHNLPRLARLLAVAAITSALVGLVLPASSAQATEQQPVQLSAKPVDQPGEFFDLTLEPGETRRLEIALGNHGGTPISARTYAADVYTIINGGFGAALRGTEPSGTTTWLDYPTEVRTLQPDRATVRPFTVTVPEGTPAGEYITSVVLENDDVVKGEGSVALDQIVRQAVAVAVRVPGPLTPGLAVGAAAHTVAAERSVVEVEVSNTGGLRLTPSSELLLRDGSGAVVSRTTVSMDSFYAGTTTEVEAVLETPLRPGSYTVDLTLDDDERDAHAEAQGLPLTVVAPAEDRVGAESVGRQFVGVLQAGPEHLPTWAAVLALLTGTALLAGLLVVRHRSVRQSAPAPAPDPADS